MASVLIIGARHDLLETVVLTLRSAGFLVHVAESVASASALARASPPIAVVIERALAAADPSAFGLPVLQGGAFILFRTADDSADVYSPGLARAAMAELTLPLEKQRLTALLQRLAERHRSRRGDLGGPEPRPS